MTYNFSDLLPYGSDHRITSFNERIRILQLVIFFCEISRMAIKSYIYGEYQDFDAQVSENLCQIRAYQLSLITDKNEEVIRDLALLSIKIKEIQANCDSLLAKYFIFKKKRPSHYTTDLDKISYFKSYLEEASIDIALSEDEYFLIQCYFLSRYKVIDEHEISYGIDYNQLCKETLIESKTFARKIVHHIQRSISKLSCNFIFKLLFELGAEPKRVDLLKSLYFQDEIGRNLLPSYEVTKIILEHAYQSKKLINVAVTRIFHDKKDYLVLHLKPSSTNRYFELTSSFLDTPTPIILFRGIVRYSDYSYETKEQYIERFQNLGFERIILCNMAQHPQYTGLALDDKKFNPYKKLNANGLPASYGAYIQEQEKEFLRFKYLAAEIGCLPENLSLFLLTHVRCANSQLPVFSSISEPAL